MSLGLFNPWWRDPSLVEDIEKVKEALSKGKRLVYGKPKSGWYVIVGPRQVGKTTCLYLMIRSLLGAEEAKNVVYASCEVFTSFRDLLDLLRGPWRWLFLDEITFLEGWERAVKVALDLGLLKSKNVYMTGSSTAFLKKETFPGRGMKFVEMLPLDFRRFCLLFAEGKLRQALKEPSWRALYAFVDELNELLRHYLRCGGFPRAMYEEMEGGGVSDSTYETLLYWIGGDVLKLSRSKEIAFAVLKGIARRYGTRFSLNALRSELALGSHRTVGEYLELLESLFVLRQYFQLRGMDKLLRKERKAYFVDPLLANLAAKVLLGREIEESLLVEGVVGEHLKRAYPEPRHVVGFFVGQHSETDFVVHPERIGVEVKWKRKVRGEEFPNPRKFKRKLLLSVEDYEEGEVAVVPVSVFLATLEIPSEVPYRITR